MVELLLLFMLYISPIYNSFLFIFNIEAASGQLAIVYALIVSISDFVFLRYALSTLTRIRKSAFLICSGALLIIILFIFTFWNYGYLNADFKAEFLSYTSMTLASVFMGIYLSKRNSLQKVVKWIPPIVTIITIVVFLASIFSSSTTTGGYMSDASGLTYQNTAYYATYAFGLTIFYLYIKDMLDLPQFLKSKWITTIMYIYIILQIVVCLISGGRGGTLLLLILGMYYMIFLMEKDIKQKIIRIFVVIVLLIFTWLIFEKLNSSISHTGFNRLLSIFSDNSDGGRKLLQQAAIESFKSSIIFGNGIGSVFYEIGQYSHNMFTDILVESGLVGLTLVISILILFFGKSIKIVRKNPTVHFVIITFICGFTLNMFSGYFWASQQFWFAISFILSYSHLENIKL